MRSRRRRLGLRARAALGFGLTALFVAMALSSVTYFVARGYLIDQRESAALRQAYVNARLVRTVLRDPSADVGSFLSGLGGGSASTALLRHRGEWFSTSVAIGADSVPRGLVSAVGEGRAAHQRFDSDPGGLSLGVGVPIAAADALYFEVFPLGELDRTLGLLVRAIGFGALSASVIAGIVGWLMARQVVRPLAPVAVAAERIASGALDTRLERLGDPDLDRLTDAFNAMASALETRVEREARFAADVSHELRSPLTAVVAAVEIIERRRDQLPPQVADAFTVLAEKVQGFQRIVLDLLEISRMDAGTADLAFTSIELRPFLHDLVTSHGASPSVLDIDPSTPSHIEGDRRRLAQALGNIVDNARNYAGGVTRIGVTSPVDGFVRLEFDDAGPGVPEAERRAIFGRFARGRAGHDAGSSTGTGLGLALVSEHLRLHGGGIAVSDSPAGGARFIVELPERQDAR